MENLRYYRVIYTSTGVESERHLNVMADNVESAMLLTANNCKQQGETMLSAIAVIPSGMMRDMNTP